MALNRSDKSRILLRYFPGMTRNSEMSTEPSTTVAHDRPEGRAVLKSAMSSYGVLALLLSEQAKSSDGSRLRVAS